MTETQSLSETFITYLEKLNADENRAALAALRRGLGKPPGSVADVHRYVVPFLPKDAKPWEENHFYLIASLFASHPKSGGTGNMGDHFAELHLKTDSDSIEKRFTALLNAHRDDLTDRLRHAISLLKSKDIPVNWQLLFNDLRWWDDEKRRVHRRWAKSFWKHRNKESDAIKASTQEEV